MNETDKIAKLRAAVQKFGCASCIHRNRSGSIEEKVYGPCSAGNSPDTIISYAAHQQDCPDNPNQSSHRG